jgi:hypothetical protein
MIAASGIQKYKPAPRRKPNRFLPFLNDRLLTLFNPNPASWFEVEIIPNFFWDDNSPEFV